MYISDDCLYIDHIMNNLYSLSILNLSSYIKYNNYNDTLLILLIFIY